MPDSQMKTSLVVSLTDELTKPLQELMDKFNGLSAQLTAMDEKVSAANKALENLTNTAQNLNNTAGETIKPVQGAAEACNNLGEKAKGVQKPLENAAENIKDLGEKANDANGAGEKLTGTINDINIKANDASGNLEEMADRHKQGAEAADNQTKAESALADTLGKIQSIGQGMMSVGTALTAPAVAGGRFALEAVRSYSDVEQSVLRLQNTFAEGVDSTEQMEEMLALAENLGVQLPGSTKDMLDMFSALAEQGVATETILNGMGHAAANYATLFGIPFEQAAVMVSKFGEALGTSDTEAVELVDTLQKLKGASGLSTDDLYETFKYLGSTLKTMGVQGLDGTKQLSAVLALMAKDSQEGSQAGTSLAGGLQQLAMMQSKEGRKAFQQGAGQALKEKGITLDFFDAEGSFIGLERMVAELQKLQALSQQEQLQVLSQLFGTQAARAMSVLVRQGTSGLQAMQTSMDKQKDTQTKVNDIMGSLAMKWESLVGTADTLKSKIGEHLEKMLGFKNLLDKVNTILGDINTWIDKNPGKFESILKTFVAMVSAVGAIGVSLSVVGAALGTFVTATLAVGKLPIFTGMLKGMKQASLSFRGDLAVCASQLKPWISKIGTAVASASKWISNLSWVQKAASWLSKGAAGISKVAGSRIWTLLADLPFARHALAIARCNAAGLAFTVVLELIQRNWSKITSFFEGIGAGFMSAWDEVVEAAQQAAAAFEPVVRDISQALDWLLGTDTKDADPAAFANGFGLGKTFADVLKLVIKIAEYVGYFCKALTDSVADVGKMLGSTFNWIEGKMDYLKGLVGFSSNANPFGARGLELQRQLPAVSGNAAGPTNTTNNNTRNTTININGAGNPVALGETIASRLAYEGMC